MTTNLRLGNLLAIVLLGGLGACTTQAVTTGTGGAGGAGGAAAGGATGIVCHLENNTTNLEASPGVACPPPAASGLITDFTFSADAGVPDGGAPPRFGDDSTVLSGGGTTYANTPGTINVSDISQGNWHIQGNVANYAGFSLYIDDIVVSGKQCNMIDASKFTGISFTIWGTTADNPISMAMGIVDDTPSYSWFKSINATVMTPPTPAGACIPNSGGAQYYHPGCSDPTAPAFKITSTTTPQTVTFHWTDFVGGDCKANVDPTQIVTIAWQFAWSMGATPYAVDIHIDDLKFITN